MEICDLLKEYSGKNVILIDMSWVLYRSYYAFKELTNQEGKPTGQYYGLSNLLKRVSDSYPDALILVVDDGNPVERKELNESYKGNREHSVHFDDKKYIVDCLIYPLPNCFRVYHPTLEADDLLYSISKIKDFNNNYIIHTSDKDLLQAIDDTTSWSREFKQGRFIKIDNNSDYYIKNFEGLLPVQLPYYRAVLGDPSDNLSIIRPRFPSKVAYYFASHYISPEGVVSKPQTKPDDLTDRQYGCLLEIYQSEQFMNNLNIMKLEAQQEIPIVIKNKSSYEVSKVLDDFELNQYKNWLIGKGLKL